MESRREFLRQASITLLLVPIGAAACGSSTSVSAVTGVTEAGGCSGVGATSTVVGGHAHTVCVDAADLASPPAQGMTFTTGVSVNHTHTVTLGQAELGTIAAGGEVTVATSTVLSHSHEFMLVRMAKIQVDAGGGGGGSRSSGSSGSSGGAPTGSSGGGGSSGVGY